MTTDNANLANKTGLPIFNRQWLGDLHTDSIHLRCLVECLDDIYQGGGGNKGQVAALITAISEKAKRVDDGLEKLWDGVACLKAMG